MRSWQKCCNYMLCVGMLTFSCGPAFAAGEWEGRLNVTSGTAESRLSFGQRIDGTLGIDGQHDVPALFGGSLKAWFDIGGAPHWRDIQGSGVGQGGQWVLQVDSPQLGQAVEVQWQVPAAGPGGLVMIDLADGQRIDMKQQSSYRYINQGSRQFRLVSGPE